MQKKWANKTTLTIPADVTHKARVRALTESTSMSAIVTSLLRGWLDGEIELPQPKPEKGGGKTKK